MSTSPQWDAFYTLIGFGPGPFSDTDTGWNKGRGVRSYKKAHTARTALKNANLPYGAAYRILATVTYADGTVETSWLD